MHIYELNGKRPRIHKTARVLQGAVVAGDVLIGPDVLIGWNAIIYAEEEALEIGRGAHIGEGVLLHAKKAPVRVGEYSSIGHGAQVCNATVEDYAKVGINSVVLNGARVVERSMLAADSFLWKEVTSPGTLWAGRPAKEVELQGGDQVRELEERSRERLAIFDTLRGIDLEQSQFE